MSQSSATRLSPRMAGGGIFWTRDGGTGFSMDPGWKEGVFCGTLDGGRRNSVGPWMEGGGKPWDPGESTINLSLINDVVYGGR